jgi:hypothetical protein
MLSYSEMILLKTEGQDSSVDTAPGYGLNVRGKGKIFLFSVMFRWIWGTFNPLSNEYCGQFSLR